MFIAHASAQELRLTARTDSSTYKLGTWIILHVDGDIPNNVQSIGPAAKDSIGPFELLRIDTLEAYHENDRMQPSWTLRLITFDSGKVFIPPIPFSYTATGDSTRRIAMTNPVFLTITGLQVDPKGELKDIKPPLDAPWLFADFLPYIIALVVIALAGAAYYYYRKKKKQKEKGFVPAKPAIPPAQVALAALRQLEDKHLWQQGKIKEFYSEATEIIRRFLEDQFGILALESTSDEIMQQLKQRQEAQTLLKQFLSFFTTADLVKFAKYTPTPTEHETELRWAYEFVRTMMPRPTQPTKQLMEEPADAR